MPKELWKSVAMGAWTFLRLGMSSLPIFFLKCQQSKYSLQYFRYRWFFTTSSRPSVWIVLTLSAGPHDGFLQQYSAFLKARIAIKPTLSSTSPHLFMRTSSKTVYHHTVPTHASDCDDYLMLITERKVRVEQPWSASTVLILYKSIRLVSQKLWSCRFVRRSTRSNSKLVHTDFNETT